MLAPKAAYLASVISDPESTRVVERAAQHPDAKVRVAAAAGLRNLPERDAEPEVDRLLDDDDVGVRKVALVSRRLRLPGNDKARAAAGCGGF